MTLLCAALRRLDCFAADWGASAVALAIRCFVAWQFVKAGMVKLSDWEATRALFREEYQVPLLPPDLAAVLGTGGELVLPLLLVCGLLTRPAALGLFVVNAMAVVSYPALFMFDCPAALQQHVYWGALLLALFAMGPGRWALDRFILTRTPA